MRKDLSHLVYSQESGWSWREPRRINTASSRAADRKRRGPRKRRGRLRRQVLERDGHVCAYCGEEATTVDHIVALSKGGADTVENMVAACLPCNKSLGWLGL